MWTSNASNCAKREIIHQVGNKTWAIGLRKLRCRDEGHASRAFRQAFFKGVNQPDDSGSRQADSPTLQATGPAIACP